jgi:hypothetical protein
MTNSRNRFLLGLAFALCVCVGAMLLGAPLSAQSTFGSISGTVQDASGAAVPGAQVALTSAATAEKQIVTRVLMASIPSSI